MLSFLRQPFPVSELSLAKNLGLSVFFGVLISFWLVVFQPFGIYNWQDPNKNLLLSGYGLVGAFSVFLNYYVFRRMLPQVFTEFRWNVGREIVWNLFHFITGGFLSTLYGAAMGLMPFTITQISYMIMVAFLMGIVPAVMLVLMIYVYLLHKYKPLAAGGRADHSLPTSILPVATAVPDSTALTLSAENEKDLLTLKPEDLLYIEASDNYCTVYYLQEGRVQKQLLRSSLSRLESMIVLPGVVRCHRSYLVNLAEVATVSGNAQGYRLHFAQSDLTVPVARASSGLVKSYFIEG